ncbi:hypothetical protein ABB02_00652 [Clostridiaceae bacterium JG1575]|nr:hypothetical protein ABB02_00652 [Clostridiaceae bacterium JG1575]
MKTYQKILGACLVAASLAACAPQKSTQDPSKPGSNSSSAPVATGTDQANHPTTLDRNVVLAQGKDGIKVLQGDVEDQFQRLLKGYTAQYGEAAIQQNMAALQKDKAKILDQKVNSQVLLRKAKQMNIPESSPEMEKEYQKVIADYEKQYGSKEKFLAGLKQSGYTEASFKEEVITSLRFDALLNKISEKLPVSDEEIQKKYNEVKENQFRVGPGAEVFHIFFGGAEVPDAEKKAKEAKEKLDQGAKFSDIAKEYGKDGTVKTGGFLSDVPWETTKFAPDFMKAASQLKDKEISAPVKTTFGWHLIKVERVRTAPITRGLEDEIRQDATGEYRKVKDIVKEQLMLAKKDEAIRTSIADWNKEYDVKKYPEKIYMAPVEKKPALSVPNQKGTTGTSSDTKAPEKTSKP